MKIATAATIAQNLEHSLVNSYPNPNPANRRWLPTWEKPPDRDVLKLNAVPFAIRDQLHRRSRETNRSEVELMQEILKDGEIPIPPSGDPIFLQQLTRIRSLAADAGSWRARTQPLQVHDLPEETLQRLNSLATKTEVSLDELATYLLHQGCRRSYWGRRRRASVLESRRVPTLPRRTDILPPFGLTPCLLEAVERKETASTAQTFHLVLGHLPREVIGFLEGQAETCGHPTGTIAIELLEVMLQERSLNPDRVRRELLRFRCWLTTIDPFDLCPLQIVHFPSPTLGKLLALARQHGTSVQEMMGCQLWLHARQTWQPKIFG
jgi:hypothetical protein